MKNLKTHIAYLAIILLTASAAVNVWIDAVGTYSDSWQIGRYGIIITNDTSKSSLGFDKAITLRDAEDSTYAMITASEMIINNGVDTVYHFVVPINQAYKDSLNNYSGQMFMLGADLTLSPLNWSAVGDSVGEVSVSVSSDTTKVLYDDGYSSAYSASDFGEQIVIVGTQIRLQSPDGQDLGALITVPYADSAGVVDSLSTPTRFESDTLIGIPLPGMIEYADDRFYITNVGVQRAIDRTSDVVVATDSVINTTDETTIWTGVLGENALKEGNVLKVYASGDITNASASDDITIRTYIGATLLEEYKPAIGNVSNAEWFVEHIMTIRIADTLGAIVFSGHINIAGSDKYVHSITDTLNTTIAEDITITAQWDNANANNKLYIWQGLMEFKN